MTDLLALLAGGDRRSIGRANEVAAMVLVQPERIGELLDGLTRADAVIAARAADALEKVSAARPDLLALCTQRLLDLADKASQMEVRWHLAQMIPRLPLSAAQRRSVFDRFVEDLNHRSSIVRTFALQALAELAQDDATLRPAADEHLHRAAASGSPAMQTRARKLLAQRAGKSAR